VAYIEKVCEYSGDYPKPSWMMYYYKRNSIQVLPKYRKNFKLDNFKNKEYTLHITKIMGIKYKCLKGYYKYPDGSIKPYSIEWDYYLEIPGMKENNKQYLYWNYSHDIKAVKYKIAKLLGTSKKELEKHIVKYKTYDDLLESYKGKENEI
jgi:hypothetical protein